MLSHKNKENCNDCGLLRTFTVLLQRTHTQASFPLRGGTSQNKRSLVHLTPENGDCVRWGGAWLAWHGAGVSFLWHRFSLLCCVFPWHQAAYSPTPPLEGDSLEVEKEKKQGKRWRLGLVSATRCRAMWPFYRTSSMNVFNTLFGLGWHKHVAFADHSYWLVIETEYFTNY